ncbi:MULTISPECIES: hypothetical protein [Pseudomonas]|nr:MULTISPECIES: hypothetical protein [Pseudomonas]
MGASDNEAGGTITVLDRAAFAEVANLAANASKVYQQGFIHIECQP